MSALAGIEGLQRDSSLNGSIVLDEEEDNDSSLSGSESRDLSERDQESASGIYSDPDGWMLDRNLGTDRFISASRCIFFTILFVSAVVSAGVAFALFTAEEKDTFRRSFNAEAQEVVLYSNHNVDNAFAALQSLSSFTTTLVKRTSTLSNFSITPGFIDMPDIRYQMGLARDTTDALAIAYTPKVLNKGYDDWVKYSEQHKDWISMNQPDGAVDILPEITPYVWQWADDPEFIGSGGTSSTEIDESDSGSRNARALRPRSFYSNERSSDCSGKHFQRRSLRARERRGANREARSFRSLHDGEAIADKSEVDGNEMHDDVDAPQIKVPSPRSESYYAPVWHLVPIPTINETHREVPIVNYNLMDRSVFRKAANFLKHSRTPVFLDVCDQAAWFGIEDHKDIIQTVVTVPVFGDFEDDAPIVGFFAIIIPWINFFKNNVNRDSKEIVVVMNNTCDEIFTVSISGSDIKILGEEDLHNPQYDDMAQEAEFARAYNRKELEGHEGDICLYTMTIYPTASYEASYKTNRPWITSILVVLVFLFTSFAFVFFDCLVTKRQTKLLNTALRQNAIVNSLFPKSVHEKLMEEAKQKLEADAEKKSRSKPHKRNLVSFLNEDEGEQERVVPLSSKPIADFFPNTTIMFADIAGFTAWSSTREPEAVFTLLETLYRAFDKIAKRRRVFKVEVVGDCYVAVCGLPNPRKDHFTVMCRFAQDCLSAMQIYSKELEVSLGPDTGELGLRVGLHSGPVVAGVLRGEKSRFQLFGDTMNTASRMESTGIPNRIQLSQTTADLLIEHGREHWILKRPEKVKAKGKGEMTTYFLSSAKSKSTGGHIRAKVTLRDDELILVNQDKGDVSTRGLKLAQKRNRTADWVIEMLGKLLKEIVARRKLIETKPDGQSSIEKLENQTIGDVPKSTSDQTVIDEVVDCLNLPTSSATKAELEENSTQLDQEVFDELRDYVYSIASMYRKNAFHNFEHASHVSMSCIKLLNRIASCEDQYEGDNHSYGICADPLTPFAIVFSALIHDVDHTGAPNVQLVKEGAPVAAMYKKKSVAEQNSIDVGWGLLMEPAYANLRRHIYTTVEEFKCFRQIVVNCVMATDIVDKDLIKARNHRWDLAFSDQNSNGDCNEIADVPSPDYESIRQMNKRRATIVIDHLMQLSDVAHTMQHWHIYRRWNERFFEESYVAYASCRAEKNPADYWYQGELGFYDFYIIPLANKIKQCQVFGVSSDEYLSYALQNRQEWEQRGMEIVEDMARKYEAIHNSGISRQLFELETKSNIYGKGEETKGENN